jgi:Domain of unknown function (DUF6046)
MDTIITDTIRSLVIQANLNNVQVENAQKNPYIIAEGEKQDETKFVSKLGTPVYSNIIFNASQVLKDNKIVDKWDDLRIDDCLISVDQAKKIITTEIAGRDGTVKEYIGLDDFQINIVGRLTGSYGVNPKENAKILKTILSASQPLAITNWWLQNLDITDIVVTGFNFAQTEGEYSTQYFSFSAISDNPVEALITNQNA